VSRIRGYDLSPLPATIAAAVEAVLRDAAAGADSNEPCVRLLHVAAIHRAEDRPGASSSTPSVLLVDRDGLSHVERCPPSWVPVAWPCDAFALGVAATHARRLARRADDAIGDRPDDLATILHPAGVHRFEYDLGSGRRVPIPGDAEFLGDSPVDMEATLACIEPDDARRVRDAFERSREDGAPYRVEFRWRSRRGGLRWLRAVGTVFGRGPNGPGCLRGVTIDIDALRTLSTRIGLVEAQVGSAFVGGAMIQWQWTADDRSRLCLTLDPTRRDAYPARGAELVVHPDDVDADVARLDAAVAACRRYDAEVRLADGQGGWRPWRLVGDPVSGPDGCCERLVGIGLDVSELHELLGRIDEREWLLERTLASARAYLSLWDVTAGTRSTIGPAAEILGRDPLLIDDTLEMLHPDDAERVRAAAWDAIREERGFAVTYRAIRPDGRIVWIHSSGAPARDASGRVSRLLGVCIDVTVRHEIEARLARLNQVHEVALAAARLGPWRLDLATAPRYEGVRDDVIFGSTVASWDDLRSRVLAEDRARLDTLTAPDFLASDAVRSIEYRVRAPNGTVRWIACTGRAMHDEAGRPTELVGIHHDVTEEHRNRAALVDAVDQLQRVQRATGVMLWEWRRGMAAMELAPLDGSPGRELPALHPVDRMRVLRRLVESLRADRPIDVEFRIRSGGDWRWVAAHGGRGSWLGNTADDVHTGVLVDINQRRGVESALGELLHWQQAAIAAADLNLWRMDVTSSERVGGSMDQRWFGCSPSTLEEFAAMVHPDDLERVRTAWNESVASCGNFAIEFRILSPVRGERWLRLRGVPLPERGRRSRIWVGATLDITEQVRSEAELKAAVEIACEASAAKSAFLAAVSHELRTPLNAVIGYAGLLSTANLSIQQSFHLRALQAGANQLLAVINDLLDFSRIEAGSLRFDRAPFDPVACIEGTIELFAAAAEEKGLSLSMRCGCSSWPWMYGDVTRLRQVALNLLSNAVKFTTEGAVELRIDRVIDTDGDWFVIEVIDSGIGMSMSTLARLFAPFRQGEESTARRFGGSGLGLSITSRLVDLMGGRIEVESEPARGSRFRVRLPWPVDGQLPTGAFVGLQGKRVGICLASVSLTATVQAQLAVFGADAVPIDVDSRRHEGLDAIIVGVRQFEAFRGREKADLHACPIVVLLGFDDVHLFHRIEAGLVTAARALRPKELNEALCRALAIGDDGDTFGIASGMTTWTASIEAARHHALSVLIVEDNEVNQLLLHAQLESLGCSADLASSGAEALAAVIARRYDLVLMDLEMPGMDGLQSTIAIRRDPLLADAQPYIVAVTAHVFAEMQERMRSAGMDDFIAKPVVVDELRAALARAMLPRR
jgi:PAS domain S-box-containing protein